MLVNSFIPQIVHLPALSPRLILLWHYMSPPCLVPHMNTLSTSSSRHQWQSWNTCFHIARLVHRNLVQNPLMPVTHISRSPRSLLPPRRMMAPHSPYNIHMQSHKSQPLTAQPPNPYPITHHGTTNTVLINMITSPDLPLTHVHKTTIAPAYMRHQTQHLYHQHTICLRAPTLGCDLLHLYLNDEIINHTLQILHQESPHRDSRHILPTFFMNRITQ